MYGAHILRRAIVELHRAVAGALGDDAGCEAGAILVLFARTASGQYLSAACSAHIHQATRSCMRCVINCLSGA